MSSVTTLLTERLSTEFGDEATARAVVANLSAEQLAQLEAAVPAAEIATAPQLSYLPDTTEGPVDHLVVLAFGNRVAADGTVTAGPTNEALADSVESYVAEHPTPVFAQWEVADILIERGVPDVVSIEPVVGADGAVTYLSTSGVTDQVVAAADAAGTDLGRVGVVGFADHVVRCVMTATASGIEDAVVVDGLALPTAYDPESGQEWTRDRFAYLTVDLSGRIGAR